MFSLTSAAAAQIQQAATASDAQHMALRIAARQDADGEVEYGMGFDEVRDDDLRLNLAGVSVLIAMEHEALLDQTVLDFVELRPGEFNFIFADASQFPDGGRNAPGCGSSRAGGCGSGGCGGGACSSAGGPH